MYDNATSQLYLLEWWESGSYLWTLLLSLITLDAKNCLRIERKKSWSPHFTIFLINSYLSFPMFHFWLCPAYKATILFIGKDAVVKETQNWSILIFKQFNKPFMEQRTKFDNSTVRLNNFQHSAINLTEEITHTNTPTFLARYSNQKNFALTLFQ